MGFNLMLFLLARNMKAEEEEYAQLRDDDSIHPDEGQEPSTVDIGNGWRAKKTPDEPILNEDSDDDEPVEANSSFLMSLASRSISLSGLDEFSELEKNQVVRTMSVA
jgi:hypothetical protein